MVRHNLRLLDQDYIRRIILYKIIPEGKQTMLEATDELNLNVCVKRLKMFDDWLDSAYIKHSEARVLNEWYKNAIEELTKYNAIIEKSHDDSEE